MLANGHRIDDHLQKIVANADDLQHLLRRHPEGFMNNQELLKHLNYTVLVMTEVMLKILKFLLNRHDISATEDVAALLEHARSYDILSEELLSRVEQLFHLRHSLNSRYPYLKANHIVRRTHTGIEGFRRFVNTVSPMI